MTDHQPSDEDDETSGKDRSNDRSVAFRLAFGLGPLTKLLENLNIQTADDAPPNVEGRVGWRTIADRPTGPSRSEVESGSQDRSAPRSATDDYRIDTRRVGEEFIVTADIPGTRREDLSVGIRTDTNEVVIAEAGTILRQIALPWDTATATDVQLHNGVLTVHLEAGND